MENDMTRLLLKLLGFAAGLVMGACLSAAPVLAQGAETRVIVPDAPNGVIVSGCYEAVGRIYQKYRFEFCLKQRGTYEIRGGGVRCDGRLDWNVRGANVQVELRRSRCGNGVAWSADSMTCKPNLLLGIIGLITDKPFLNALVCDYKPARGSGEEPSRFVVRRTGS
jgi:hypothetical protein